MLHGAERHTQRMNERSQADAADPALPDRQRRPLEGEEPGHKTVLRTVLCLANPSRMLAARWTAPKALRGWVHLVRPGKTISTSSTTTIAATKGNAPAKMSRMEMRGSLSADFTV
jgi:hypothetical protein